MCPTPPHSEQELFQRSLHLAGQSLAELATQAGVSLPDNLKREKGWVGQLLEWHLGATAGSKPEQDFPDLGIELKTLPIDETGRPLETTFVCVAPLLGIAGQRWEESSVRNKLSRVLWIPVEASRALPLGARRVASPFLWSPSPEEEALLRQDWEELMEQIAWAASSRSVPARARYCNYDRRRPMAGPSPPPSACKASASRPAPAAST